MDLENDAVVTIVNDGQVEWTTPGNLEGDLRKLGWREDSPGVWYEPIGDDPYTELCSTVAAEIVGDDGDSIDLIREIKATRKHQTFRYSPSRDCWIMSAAI